MNTSEYDVLQAYFGLPVDFLEEVNPNSINQHTENSFQSFIQLSQSLAALEEPL
jgi:hypothetical protein